MLLVAYGVVRLVAWAPGPERDRALVLRRARRWRAIAAAVLLALLGPDYLIARNVLAAWLPLAIALAAGFAAPRAPRAGIAAAALLCAIGVVDGHRGRAQRALPARRLARRGEGARQRRTSRGRSS